MNLDNRPQHTFVLSGSGPMGSEHANQCQCPPGYEYKGQYKNCINLERMLCGYSLQEPCIVSVCSLPDAIPVHSSEIPVYCPSNYCDKSGCYQTWCIE